MSGSQMLKMDRRKFLAMSCALAACGVGKAGPGDSVKIPEWAGREIAATLARYRAWKGGDVTVAFPIITDVHSKTTDLPEDLSFGDSKMHVFLAQHAADEAGADFLADLGDIDLDLGVPIDKNWPPKFRFCSPEEMQRRVETQRTIYRDWQRPVLFALGNHDHSRGRFSSAAFGDAFNRGITAAHGHKVTLGDDGSYGYYDVPAKKTRAIFLNSSDEGYYGYSVKQLAFLARALGTVPTGVTALLVQHFCIKTEIGYWKTFRTTRAKRQEIAIRMLEDFVAHRAGEADGMKWNFTGLKDTSFAGCFFGDSHFDNYVKANGVDYSISQGYGGVSPKEIENGGVFTPFSRSKQMLVDLVAVKPGKREVKIFRIGAGGAARDRGYAYGGVAGI